MKEKKPRFVNEALLVQNLPIFLCGSGKVTEEKLEGIINLIEENLIIQKAKEIEGRRAAEKAARPHECFTDADGQCVTCGKLY